MLTGPKYLKDLGDIVLHAMQWIGLMVHPIMANIPAAYIFAKQETKQHLYSIAVAQPEIENIVLYNNITCDVLLPVKDRVYKNLTTIRVGTGNLYNIFNLIKHDALPALRVLDIATNEVSLITLHKIPTLEDLRVVQKRSSNGEIYLSDIMTCFENIKRLGLEKFNIVVDTMLLNELQLLQCKVKIVEMFRCERLLMHLCKCRSDKSILATLFLLIDLESYDNKRILIHRHVTELKLLNFHEYRDGLPRDLTKLLLYNTICTLKEGITELSLSFFMPDNIPNSVSKLNIAHSYLPDVYPTNLTSLTLYDMGGVTDDISIVKACPNLTHLEFVSCRFDDKHTGIISRDNLSLCYYRCDWNGRKLYVGKLKSLYVIGLPFTEVEVDEVSDIRISSTGVSGMGVAEFALHCNEEYANLYINLLQYEVIMMDLIGMANLNPKLYRSYYEYFVKLQLSVDIPLNKKVFESLLIDGNELSVIKLVRSEFTLRSIREGNMDNDDLLQLHKQYIALQAKLSLIKDSQPNLNYLSSRESLDCELAANEEISDGTSDDTDLDAELYEEGYEEGHTDGYNHGAGISGDTEHDQKYRDEKSKSFKRGYNDGYAEGYAEGYDEL